MSRSGTTKTQLRNRRSGRDKKTRLIVLFRRIGVSTCVIALVFWTYSWLWLGGVIDKTAEKTRQKFMRTAVAHGFTVEKILVEGRVNTDPDLLRSLLAVQKGDPIFSFDPHETQHMISQVSWIRAVQVERRLPDTIRVMLTERQPFALWQHKQKLRLVDTEGVTLTDTGLERFKSLILLAGEGAPQKAAALISMLKAEPAVKEKIEAANWVGGRRWDLRLKNGTIINLPEQDPEAALRRLALAQEKDGLLDQDIAKVDMREPDRLIVEPKAGAVQKYQASAKGRNNI